MPKGFWDFMSDFMRTPAFRYTETDEKQPKKKKRKMLELIRNGKKLVVDVDDYKILEEKDEIPRLEHI